MTAHNAKPLDTDSVSIRKSTLTEIARMIGATPFGGAYTMPSLYDRDGQLDDPDAWLLAAVAFLNCCHADTVDHNERAADTERELADLRRSLEVVGKAMRGGQR